MAPGTGRSRALPPRERGSPQPQRVGHGLGFGALNRERSIAWGALLLPEGFALESVAAYYQGRGLHLMASRPLGWFASGAAPEPILGDDANVLLARTEAIEEVQLLPVNDHLVPAQFDELVLGQEAEESLLMPDE
jgi:hypothetical protein